MKSVPGASADPVDARILRRPVGIAVYIVLGMLYESFIHPLTILSTLPSAGVGAVLSLMLLHIDSASCR